MNMMQPSKQNTQSGSAFFLILIGIFLFAGLSFALMQSSRTSMSNLSAEEARIAAQEIIAYGDEIQKAVQKLRLRGCTLREISFDDPLDNSKQKGGATILHGNPFSPADQSCHVFEQAGGKVGSRLLNAGYIDPSLVTDNTHLDSRSYQITMIRIEGAGNNSWDPSGTDLVLNIGRLQPIVCMKINDLLGVENLSTTPPIDSFDSGLADYQGTMHGNGGNPLGNIPQTAGKTAMCVGSDTSGETYTYYQALAIQ